MFQLKIINSSTRPGRKGPALAEWITGVATAHGTFQVENIDLKELNLPFFDEPEHPVLQKYQFEHTKNWSKKIGEADAFIFVLCEYNHGYPAPLKNAIDYLIKEWAYKPLGFVSYGGVSAGLRAVEMMIPVATALRMTPVPASVHIPFFTKYLTEDGGFDPDPGITKSAGVMLNDMARLVPALKTLR